jgi:hypothetical protein
MHTKLEKEAQIILLDVLYVTRLMQNLSIQPAHMVSVMCQSIFKSNTDVVCCS